MQTTETVWVIRFSKFFLQLNSTFKINNFQSLLNFEKKKQGQFMCGSGLFMRG